MKIRLLDPNTEYICSFVVPNQVAAAGFSSFH